MVLIAITADHDVDSDGDLDVDSYVNRYGVDSDGDHDDVDNDDSRS